MKKLLNFTINLKIECYEFVKTYGRNEEGCHEHHLCIKVDYDRFHYYSCNLANKNFILKGSARKKRACTMWEADKETLELIYKIYERFH